MIEIQLVPSQIVTITLSLMISPVWTSLLSNTVVDIVFINPDPLASRYGVEIHIFPFEATARANQGLRVGSYAFDILFLHFTKQVLWAMID